MTYDPGQSKLSKYLLIGLLTGLIALMLDFVLYGVLSTSEIGATTSNIVNPFSLLYGCTVPAILGGVLYSSLSEVKSGPTIFIVIFLVITIVIAFALVSTHSSNDNAATKQYQKLLISLIMVPLLFTTFLLPYFAKHENVIAAVI